MKTTRLDTRDCRIIALALQQKAADDAKVARDEPVMKETFEAQAERADKLAAIFWDAQYSEVTVSST